MFSKHSYILFIIMTENSWFCVGLLKMASTTEHGNALYEELALLLYNISVRVTFYVYLLLYLKHTKWNHRTSWAGRGPQRSSSLTPGSTQDYSRFKPYFWECCPNASWSLVGLYLGGMFPLFLFWQRFSWVCDFPIAYEDTYLIVWWEEFVRLRVYETLRGQML